ncbi:unnamed protein product [Urochloa decumbens]|uniref:F-box domain-containing protein n=1 Tax=Urochloa decumbens TaxID=240449 RepID=A0ABC9F727_9POAL
MPPCGGDGSGVAPPAASADGFDALPDEVLHHILGFLEAYEAVRTCVLAKRWRHLWRHATGLRVAAADEDAFLESVEKTWEFLDHLLPLREGSPLQTCELRFGELGYNEPALLDDDGTRRVNTWFWHAIMHKVRDLSLYAYFDLHHGLELYDMPLNSQHLTRLEFTGVEVFSSTFLNFSNCPALEYLRFERCEFSYNISSKSLKRLIITSDCFGTPVLESMPSLVEAFIDLEAEHNSYVIVGNIGSNSGMLVIFRWCPIFSKLKTLLLDDNWCMPDDFRALVCFLEHSPVLEKLTLELSSKRRKSEIIIKGNVRPMEGSAAILEHLKLVEVKCMAVDERIFKLLMFLCAFKIRLTTFDTDSDSE